MTIFSGKNGHWTFCPRGVRYFRAQLLFFQVPSWFPFLKKKIPRAFVVWAQQIPVVSTCDDQYQMHECVCAGGTSS